MELLLLLRGWTDDFEHHRQDMILQDIFALVLVEISRLFCYVGKVSEESERVLVEEVLEAGLDCVQEVYNCLETASGLHNCFVCPGHAILKCKQNSDPTSE